MDKLRDNGWVIALVIAVVIFIIDGYVFDWQWTGFPDLGQPDQNNYERGKTVWDWLDLLIVPGVLAGGALWFNHLASERQSASQQEQFREEALQKYFDIMTDLLVNNGLRDQDEYAPVSDVARTRTITILRKLDRDRITEVLDFLRDADLYGGEKGILKGARMSRIDLHLINLWRANMTRADLSHANLSGADLYGTDLRQAQLSGADMRNANLNHARLKDTTIDSATRFNANTTLPDGRKWASGTDMTQFGLIVETSSRDIV